MLALRHNEFRVPVGRYLQPRREVSGRVVDLKVHDFHWKTIRYLVKEGTQQTQDLGGRSLHVICGAHWRETRLELDSLGAVIII